jgi:predicted hotdog family 3-hydroxylacyl-ACP dehydratase
LLKRATIAGLIPHQGRMCLLDCVEAWDQSSIRCRSNAHVDPWNPLRRGGRLAGVCTIELGLQAMALHGALAAGGPQAPGFVTSLREVEIAAAFAEELEGPLAVEAVLLASERRGHVYRFRVSAGDGRPVSSGEAMIFLPEEAPA